jgi:hypothetical protein
LVVQYSPVAADTGMAAVLLAAHRVVGGGLSSRNLSVRHL